MYYLLQFFAKMARLLVIILCKKKSRTYDYYNYPYRIGYFSAYNRFL